MSAIETLTTAIPAGTWKIDPAHSRVEFSIRHLAVSATPEPSVLKGLEKPAEKVAAK